MICVWIVSPIPALRAGLRALLSGDPEVSVVSASSSVAGAQDFPCDEGVLLATPGALEEQAIEMLARQPGWSVLLVGDNLQAALELAKGLPQGRSWGMLSSDATPEALHAALHAVREGLVLVSSELAARMLSQLPVEENSVASADEDPPEPLTEREIDVLRLAAQGLTNKQIALALKISEHTVKFHISAIYTRLAVSNRAEAVRKGARWGWVPL